MELSDVIRNKVRKALVLALPPEDLDKYIKEEWDSFFKEEQLGYYKQPSTFQLMLHEEIQNRVRLQLKKWMDENFEKTWVGKEELLIGEMVEKFTPIVLKRLSYGLASQVLSEISQRLHIQQ